MEKRLIAAVALSVLIIVFFQYFGKTGKPAQNSLPPEAETYESAKIVDTQQKDITKDIPVNMNENLDIMENDKYLIEFSNVNGAIKRICLKHYSESGGAIPYCLSEIKSQDSYIGTIKTNDFNRKLDESEYVLEKSDTSIIYKLNTTGILVSKRYAFIKDKYGIGLQVLMKNLSTSPITIDYSIITGSGVNEATSQNKQFVEVSSKINDKIVGFKHPKELKITNPGKVEWTALKNKYFSLIFKPFTETIGQFYLNSSDGYLVNGVNIAKFTIEPGQTAEQKYIIYAGPTDSSKMNEIGYQLDESVINSNIQSGTIVGNRYELVRSIGSGSFGDVWEAFDLLNGHLRVAIKLLHAGRSASEVRTRFARECSALELLIPRPLPLESACCRAAASSSRLILASMVT